MRCDPLLLREHRAAQLRARMHAGEAWEDNDPVCCRDDGMPWKPDFVSRRFPLAHSGTSCDPSPRGASRCKERCLPRSAEADGNRTHRRRSAPSTDFEDRSCGLKAGELSARLGGDPAGDPRIAAARELLAEHHQPITMTPRDLRALLARYQRRLHELLETLGHGGADA